MNIEVNGKIIQVKLFKNNSAEAVKELLKKGPLTLTMKDYAHMEKFGSLGMQLPRNDRLITTKAGDVILSEGHLLVLYYGPNTWNFTKIGTVQNMTERQLRDTLGKEDIQAIITLDEEEK